MSATGDADDTEKEKIRLIEADLTQTNEFVKGVLGTSAAIRGSAITIWLALLGFAVQQSIPTLALLASLVSIAFWLADGYHGWLYGEAFGHAQKIERVLASYYDDLSRRMDSEFAHARFTGKLRAHRYGLYNGLQRGFSVKQLWKASRPHIFYRYLYPALVVIATFFAAAGFAGLDLKATNPSPTRVIIEQPTRSSPPSSASTSPPALNTAELTRTTLPTPEPTVLTPSPLPTR